MGSGAKWDLARILECDVCKVERKRRHRVLPPRSEDRAASLDAFSDAPYIHPYNVPKYLASSLRAVQFARKRQLQVLWVRAVDLPVAGEDTSLRAAQLNAARLRWLQLHDRQTGGIPGLFPLVKDLPLQFTTTYNRDVGLFKFTRCTLWGLAVAYI